MWSFQLFLTLIFVPSCVFSSPLPSPLVLSTTQVTESDHFCQKLCYDQSVISSMFAFSSRPVSSNSVELSVMFKYHDVWSLTMVRLFFIKDDLIRVANNQCFDSLDSVLPSFREFVGQDAVTSVESCAGSLCLNLNTRKVVTYPKLEDGSFGKPWTNSPPIKQAKKLSSELLSVNYDLIKDEGSDFVHDYTLQLSRVISKVVTITEMYHLNSFTSLQNVSSFVMLPYNGSPDHWFALLVDPDGAQVVKVLKTKPFNQTISKLIMTDQKLLKSNLFGCHNREVKYAPKEIYLSIDRMQNDGRYNYPGLAATPHGGPWPEPEELDEISYDIPLNSGGSMVIIIIAVLLLGLFAFFMFLSYKSFGKLEQKWTQDPELWSRRVTFRRESWMDNYSDFEKFLASKKTELSTVNSKEYPTTV